VLKISLFPLSTTPPPAILRQNPESFTSSSARG
jgi:hypothetical protein